MNINEQVERSGEEIVKDMPTKMLKTAYATIIEQLHERKNTSSALSTPTRICTLYNKFQKGNSGCNGRCPMGRSHMHCCSGRGGYIFEYGDEDYWLPLVEKELSLRKVPLFDKKALTVRKAWKVYADLDLEVADVIAHKMLFGHDDIRGDWGKCILNMEITGDDASTVLISLHDLCERLTQSIKEGRSGDINSAVIGEGGFCLVFTKHDENGDQDFGFDKEVDKAFIKAQKILKQRGKEVKKEKL
jgi:hypothetical protein